MTQSASLSTWRRVNRSVSQPARRARYEEPFGGPHGISVDGPREHGPHPKLRYETVAATPWRSATSSTMSPMMRLTSKSLGV